MTIHSTPSGTFSLSIDCPCPSDPRTALETLAQATERYTRWLDAHGAPAAPKRPFCPLAFEQRLAEHAQFNAHLAAVIAHNERRHRGY
jgi:hypothetical protein